MRQTQKELRLKISNIPDDMLTKWLATRAAKGMIKLLNFMNTGNHGPYKLTPQMLRGNVPKIDQPHARPFFNCIGLKSVVTCIDLHHSCTVAMELFQTPDLLDAINRSRT